MPEEAPLCPDDENAVQWFLRGIANKTLSVQVTMFILLALESNSDKEVKLVLIKFDYILCKPDGFQFIIYLNFNLC